MLLSSDNFQMPNTSRFNNVNGDVRLSESKAVFLDRDGVLVDDVGYLSHPENLRMMPGVSGALQMIQETFYLIIITNQSGLARGYLTENDLTLIHGRLIQELSANKVFIDGIYYCPHLPFSQVPAYNKICECRKPEPGMLLRAASEWDIDLAKSYLIGDRISDMEAASKVGVKGILVGNEEPVDNAKSFPIDWSARDVLAAVEMIIDDLDCSPI